MDFFHKVCLSGTPSENSQAEEILGIGWPEVIGLMRNESIPWEVMPEIFKCSVREMRWRLSICGKKNLEGFLNFVKIIAKEI